MIKNNLKTAFRNIISSKVFSLINIIGLTIGIASFLIIALYVFDELTYDSFHKNADNIFRVVDNRTSAGGKQVKIAGAGYQVSAQSKNVLPEVDGTVRMATFGRANVISPENNNVFYEDFTLGTEGFLTAFDFKLLQGDRSTGLVNPHSVIVTEQTALKFFNTTNVLGKIIKVDRDDIPYKITGVLKDFPKNSSISFNLLFSESSIAGDRFNSFVNSDWNSGTFTTYLSLYNKADADKVAGKINQLVKTNQKTAPAGKSTLVLQPLKDIHFYSDGIEGNAASSGNITYVYVFSVIGLFVLIIACINYMNLTTARFATRTKEIAVRKVVGASRKNLAGQFFAEAFVTTLISLVLAVIAVQMLLPYFNNFAEKSLTLGFSTDYRILIGIVLILFVVSILSGLYPSLYQSALKPLLLLKNKINISKGSVSLRKSLVVFQFTTSIVMIAITITVFLQIKYVNTKDMGFKKDQLVVVDINSGKVRRGAETIKNEFAKLPQVTDVSVSSRVPGEWKNLPKVKVNKDNGATAQANDMYFLAIDDQFLKTYKVALAKGRNFLPGMADSSSVIINQMAAKELGITEPAGQIINIPSVNFDGDFSPLDKPYMVKVVGIVKDFNVQSLREPLAPMVMALQNNPIHAIDYFTARVKGNDIAGTLKQMDAVLHNIDNTHLFEYHFLDKQWDLFYRQDKIRQTIFLAIAGLAIFISCLGLLGLSIFTAGQRVKELGIRKVLGASVSNIVMLLSKDILKLVIIAAVIATPIAWFAMQKWLQDFACRIDISWWVFCAAGAITVAIAVVTISFQAVKSALANPINSLKAE